MPRVDLGKARYILWGILLFIGSSWANAAEMTLQIINDDDTYGDGQVWVLFTGKPATGGPSESNFKAFHDLTNASQTTKSQALSDLKAAGQYTSPLSGKTRTVYEINVSQCVSGVIYFSHDFNGASGQLTVKGGSTPGFDKASAIPFQTVEVTLDGNSVAHTDLTVIDCFSFPIQLEGWKEKSTDPETGKTIPAYSVPGTLRTFYRSRAAIAKDLAAIEATTVPAGAPAGQVVRYLGPGQAIKQKTTDAAYPNSFKAYLDSISPDATFTIRNKEDAPDGWMDPDPPAPFGIPLATYKAYYNYVGKIQSDNQGGYVATLTANPKTDLVFSGMTNPDSFVTGVDTITVNLPATTDRYDSSFDELIYGAILSTGPRGAFRLGVNGMTTDMTTTDGNPFHALLEKVVTSGTVGGVNGMNFKPGGGKAFGKYVAGFNIRFQPAPEKDGGAKPAKNGAKDGPDWNETYHVATVAADGTWSLNKAIPAGAATFEIVVDDEFKQLVLTYVFTNSVYAKVVSEVFTGLNFGYIDSAIAGDSTDQWYAPFPPRYPFVNVQPDNADHYNRYAALFYMNSDAYAYAFSDAIKPSPLVGVDCTGGEKLRMTLLPANQLDTPIARVTTVSKDGVEVSWPVDHAGGVTAYYAYTQPESEVLRYPAKVGDAMPKGDTASVTFTNMEPNFPYKIYVVAEAGGETPRYSLCFPFLACNFAPTKPTPTDVPYQVSFNWNLGIDFANAKEYTLRASIDDVFSQGPTNNQMNPLPGFFASKTPEEVVGTGCVAIFRKDAGPDASALAYAGFRFVLAMNAQAKAYKPDKKASIWPGSSSAGTFAQQDGNQGLTGLQINMNYAPPELKAVSPTGGDTQYLVETPDLGSIQGDAAKGDGGHTKGAPRAATTPADGAVGESGSDAAGGAESRPASESRPTVPTEAEL